MVVDAVDGLEAQIIGAYQPVLTEESEPKSERPPPAHITHIAALEALETMTLYKLQVDSAQQLSFYRERR